jgi:hypothetical protein
LAGSIAERAEPSAGSTELCSPSADSTEDFSCEASSLLKRLNTLGVNADWAFDRTAKGVEVVMEREKVEWDDAARKAARRMRCLQFFHISIAQLAADGWNWTYMIADV